MGTSVSPKAQSEKSHIKTHMRATGGGSPQERTHHLGMFPAVFPPDPSPWLCSHQASLTWFQFHLEHTPSSVGDRMPLFLQMITERGFGGLLFRSRTSTVSPSAEGWVSKQQCSEAKIWGRSRITTLIHEWAHNLTGCLLGGEDPGYCRI